MKNLILAILALTILSGCSELQVIGGAAMRELRSESMSVEQISNRYYAKLENKEQYGIMVARSDSKRLMTVANFSDDEEKQAKIIKIKKRARGLWEKS